MQAAVAYTVLLCSHILPLYTLAEIRESESDEFNEINNVIVDSFYDSLFNMADGEKTRDHAQKATFMDTFPETTEDLEEIFPEYRLPDLERGAAVVQKLAPKRQTADRQGPNPDGKHEKHDNTTASANATTANHTTVQKNLVDENGAFLDTISALNFITNATPEKKATLNGANNNDRFDKILFDSRKKYPFVVDDYGATDLGNDPVLASCTECAKSTYSDRKCSCGDPVNEAAYYKPLNEEILSYMEAPQYRNDKTKLIYKNNPGDNVLNVKLNLQIELPNNMDRMKIMDEYMPNFIMGPQNDMHSTRRRHHEKHRTNTMENKLVRPSFNIPFPIIDIPFSPLFDAYPRKETTKIKSRRRSPVSAKSVSSKKKVSRVRARTFKKKMPSQLNNTLIEKPKRVQRIPVNVTEDANVENQPETTSQSYVDQGTSQSVLLTTSQTENILNLIMPTAQESKTINNETEMATERTSNDTKPTRRKRSPSQVTTNYLATMNKQYVLSDYVEPKTNSDKGVTVYPLIDQVESIIQIEDDVKNDQRKKLHVLLDARTESENELLYWPEFRTARNFDFEVKNITSLMVQRENNRVVNVSEDTIRRNHIKALEQAVFGEVDWTDMDTVVPAFMSFVGKYLHGVITLCSDTICHSMKCEVQTCIHRLCLPQQRRNKIGHCDLAIGAESIAPMTTIMDLPSKSVFEIMDIIKENLKRQVFGKVTLCISGKCMTFVYTKKFFTKVKCTANNLDVNGHCAGMLSDKRELVDQYYK